MVYFGVKDWRQSNMMWDTLYDIYMTAELYYIEKRFRSVNS